VYGEFVDLRRGGQPFGAAGWLDFFAPPGTSISAFTLWRSARVASDPGGSWSYETQLNVGNDTVESCTGSDGCSGLGNENDPLAAGNRISRSGLSGVTGIRAQVWCRPVPNVDCPATSDVAAEYWIHRSDIVLDDSKAPIFPATPTGGLTDSAKPQSGTQSILYSAQDEGAGVYEADLELDGTTVAVRRFSDRSSACAKPFVAAVPCPAKVDDTLSLDTNTVPNGAHTLRLVVKDATEANAVPYGPVKITIANAKPAERGPLNGQGADDAARLVAGFGRRARTRRLVRFGRRARIAGRLTNAAGAPIAGALLRVLTRSLRAGAAERDRGAVTTRSDGSFSYVVPAGPSRRVRFAYRSHVDDTAFAAVAGVVLRVRAGVVLRARPRRLRTGERVRIAGRLLGGPFPVAGKLVDLQARDAGAWRTFATARTDRRGRFVYAYRFRRTFRITRYPFRVRVRPDASYPYSLGYSRAVRVTVLP
jgi:hypothetical protein